MWVGRRDGTWVEVVWLLWWLLVLAWWGALHFIFFAFVGHG